MTSPFTGSLVEDDVEKEEEDEDEEEKSDH
jgi:hypothetical protein